MCWKALKMHVMEDIVEYKEPSLATQLRGIGMEVGMSIDVKECPNGGYSACRCERCAICGHRKHMNIHGAGFPEGRPPSYGHKFIQKEGKHG